MQDRIYDNKEHGIVMIRMEESPRNYKLFLEGKTRAQEVTEEALIDLGTETKIFEFHKKLEKYDIKIESHNLDDVYKAFQSTYQKVRNHFDYALAEKELVCGNYD